MTKTVSAALAALEQALGDAVSTRARAPRRLRRRHLLAGAARGGGRRADRAPGDRRAAARPRRRSPRCSRSPTRTGTPVVPWGGGSGTQGGCLPIRGGIVIDMTALDRDRRDRRALADGHGPGRRQRAPPGGRAERARADAAALPGLGRVGDGRRLHRRARLGRALDPLRQDRGPAAVAARGDSRRRADGHRRRPAPRRRARADPAVRRLGGHAGRDHARHAAARAAARPSAASPPSRSPRSAPGIEAIRGALQAGHRPSVVRMYDEDATRLAFSPVVGEQLSGVYTVLAFEGEPEAAQLEERRTLELAQRGRGGGARPGARAALVGPPLRLLRTAAPARAARDLGHARRRRDLLAHRRGLRGAAHARCASPTPTPASSCGCTSPTGTCGGR